MNADEAAIREVLVLFDGLSPLQYTSALQYRNSWETWQPDARGALQFALQDLSVQVGADVAYAFGLLQCGGTLRDGQRFGDTVRITFCLLKRDGQWTVAHQHVSKPIERG